MKEHDFAHVPLEIWFLALETKGNFWTVLPQCVC